MSNNTPVIAEEHVDDSSSIKNNVLGKMPYQAIWFAFAIQCLTVLSIPMVGVMGMQGPDNDIAGLSGRMATAIIVIIIVSTILDFFFAFHLHKYHDNNQHNNIIIDLEHGGWIALAILGALTHVLPLFIAFSYWGGISLFAQLPFAIIWVFLLVKKFTA